MARSRSIVSVCVGLLLVGGAAVMAADPLEVAPEMYTKNFENDRVRVMEVVFQPGQSIPEHSHPTHFAYVLEPGQLTITKAGGTPNVFDVQPGQVVWSAAETHSAVNTGTTPVRLLVVELKGE